MEMALALLLLGLLTLFGFTYLRNAEQQKVAEISIDAMTRVEQAMLGFAHSNYRLPCPAVNEEGREDCASPNQIGFLPWRTLQLATGTAYTFKYGVFRKGGGADMSVDLSRAVDRLPVVISEVAKPNADAVYLGNVTLPDFCYALKSVSDSSTYSGGLAVNDSSMTKGMRPVAYVVVAPGALDADSDGDRFDGLNHTANNSVPVFESSSRGNSHLYDDRVLSVGFSSLFAQLQCAPALSAIYSSHSNVALSLAMRRNAIGAYGNFLQANKEYAYGALVSSTAGLEAAISGLANSVRLLADAIARTSLTEGVASVLIATATIAVIASTTAVVNNSVSVASNGTGLAYAEKNLVMQKSMFSDSSNLGISIEANLRTADALGY